MVIECHELKGKGQHPAVSKYSNRMVILGKEIKSMYAEELKMFYHSEKKSHSIKLYERKEKVKTQPLIP